MTSIVGNQDARYKFKNAALAAAGVPIPRVRAAGRYDEGDGNLRARIATA